MKLSFAIVASLVAVTSASTIAVSTASTMQSILRAMTETGNQFAQINNLVNGFPQNGIKGALEIHEHETVMHDLFEQMTVSVNSLPKPVSPANVQKILEAYQAFIPTAINSVNDIAAKEADFVALPASVPSIKNDLISSNAVCKNFSGAIQSIATPDLVEALNTMVTPIEAARANAIAAFP